MGSTPDSPNPELAAAIDVPVERIVEGGVISEEEEIMREILLVPVVTPEGTMHVLREEYAGLVDTEHYLIPDARWEVVLLLRARGIRMTAIAKKVDLPVVEIIRWFYTPGIVEDLFSLFLQEERLRLEIRSRERVSQALDDPRVSVTEVMGAVKMHVELFNPRPPTADERERAQDKMAALMKTEMPVAKG